MSETYHDRFTEAEKQELFRKLDLVPREPLSRRIRTVFRVYGLELALVVTGSVLAGGWLALWLGSH